MEIKVEVPEDLKFLENVSGLEWNLLVSKILKENLKKLSQLKENLSHSRLTEKDVEELTDKINTSLSKRYN